MAQAAFERAPAGLSRTTAPSLRAVWLVAFAAALILIGLTTRDAWVGYRNTLRESLAARHSLARIADAQLSSHLRMVDNVLLDLRAMAVRRSMDARQLGARLHELKALFPFIYSLSVLDASGVVLVSSNPGVIGLDLSQRSYYRALSTSGLDQFHISEPVVAVRDVTILVASRPIPGPDGEFLGLVNITLQPDFFAQAMEVSLPPRNGAVTLAGRDGIVRMRLPARPDIIGKSIRPTPAFEQFLNSGLESADYTVTPGFDGLQRLVTCRALDYPPNLIMAVSECEAAVLADWRMQFLVTSGFSAAGVVLILTLAFLTARGVAKAHEAVQARLRQDKRSLEEKEVMLREIHHRVKNNLQIILSLLSLQSEMDPAAAWRGELSRVRDRILSMALVHEQLYKSQDLSAVNMAEYVPDLVEHIARTYRRDGRDVARSLDVQDLRLSIERAIPLGLAINELVTNAYKYAFAGEAPGRLSVTLRETAPGAAALCVEDDGPGLPAGLDPQRSGTLGLLLVSNLAGQLGGTFTLETDGGTRARIEFRHG